MISDIDRQVVVTARALREVPWLGTVHGPNRATGRIAWTQPWIVSVGDDCKIDLDVFADSWPADEIFGWSGSQRFASTIEAMDAAAREHDSFSSPARPGESIDGVCADRAAPGLLLTSDRLALVVCESGLVAAGGSPEIVAFGLLCSGFSQAGYRTHARGLSVLKAAVAMMPVTYVEIYLTQLHALMAYASRWDGEQVVKARVARGGTAGRASPSGHDGADVARGR